MTKARRKRNQAEVTAYHEAGHAVAAYYLRRAFKFVTILPNEQHGALGIEKPHLWHAITVLARELQAKGTIPWKDARGIIQQAIIDSVPPVDMSKFNVRVLSKAEAQEAEAQHLARVAEAGKAQ